ncbi:MAG TPA: 2-hydroxyacyl-CoA dehydratase [Dehalococcoidia bacterium]|nr:2-hydroxyacyl-CoA dehydratase [Dehalococcoidia bacterium]
MHMEFLETEIAKYQRRIDKIKANPDPTKLKSNLQMYELERDERIAELEAWKQGKPFASGMFPPVLLRSMGFEIYDAEMACDRMERWQVKKYLQRCRELGFPDQICDRTVLKIPMVLDEDFPNLSLVVANNWECESIPLTFQTIAHLRGIPYYYLDVPFEANEETLQYVVEQLRELIDLAESTVPGIKYDEDKLIEVQNIEKRWYELYQDIHRLKRRVPCPVPGQEAFKEPRWPSLYHDPARALEVFRIYHDEIVERAEKGISNVPEEKLRLMWAVSGPFYARPDPFSILEKRGAQAIYFQIGNASRVAGINFGIYGDETEYGRKLSPLEEEARILNQSAWGGLGRRWVDDILIACRDLKLDGIVYFQQWGCTVTDNLAKNVAEVAEQELGIPTLIIEGRLLIDEAFDPQEMEDKLNGFVDICLARKGIA